MEDTMEEVLAHLPLKSLVRCKTLSRKWQTFISGNSNFRRKYLSNTNTKNTLLLGFFVSKTGLYDVLDPVRFLPTTTEGTSISLKKRKRENDGHKLVGETRAQSVPLRIDDASLSFLGQQSIHLAGSSNGFLLCSVEHYDPKTYFLCNPINKQWVALPTPSATSQFVSHGFVCHTSSPCLDKVDHYTVVRVIKKRAGLANLRFEILSSESPQHWELINITCPFSFYPDLTNVSSAIIDKQGVIYLKVISEEPGDYCLLIFDREKKGECLQLMGFPPTEKDNCCTVHFGQSDGLLLYAQHEGDLGQLKIWVLADDKDDCTRKWSLRQKVRIEITMESFPDLVPNPVMGLLFKIISFHPTHPQVLFLKIANTVVICDVDNSALQLACDFDAQSWGLGYFIIPYTYGLIGKHLFLDS